MRQTANSGESGMQGEFRQRQQVNQPQISAPNYPQPYYNYGGQSMPTAPAPYYNTQSPAATSQQPYTNPNYGYGSQPGTPNQPIEANPNSQQQNSPFDAGIYRP